MDTETPKEKGKLAGIDFGSVRIGVAISDPDRIIASPYEIYTRKNERLDAEYFKRLVREERIVRFVVGLPLHLDGRLSEKAREALAFGARLSELTGLPVDYMDERFTSVEAGYYLREAKMTMKQRKKRTDKIAAQILLANYIERGCRGTEIPEPLDDDGPAPKELP
ncbi:MAG: Holliday junction resolvase RuvX [Thermoguttaceae bacterium]|nr:Holliday junction resolvase RuvX [Thermoguttaceae bacterium]